MPRRWISPAGNGRRSRSPGPCARRTRFSCSTSRSPPWGAPAAGAARREKNILLRGEPLSAMGARESRLIIDLVKDLASSGRVSIIVIDHNYAHLFELCDRLNVIDGGRITLDQQVHETSIEELTELMVSAYRRQLAAVQNAGA